MRQSFWEKLEELKAKGLSAEEFERIGSLEAAIAHHQNQIDDYEKEIERIKSKGDPKSERAGVVQRPTSLSF